MEKKLSKDLTYEDCVRFKEENPQLVRNDVYVHFKKYMNAMIRLGCIDELFPKKNRKKYSDEFLLNEAKKYKNKRDMREQAYWLYSSLRGYRLLSEACKHMETLGDHKKRMIYAYEFPDNSVYIGLTYDYDIRDLRHKTSLNSAVRRHAEETGLTPIHKRLVDYIPVEEAKVKEGEFVEKYRQDGWKILNIAKTGGTGGIYKKEVEGALELWKIGTPVAHIARILGVSRSTVTQKIKNLGLITKNKRYMMIKIEQCDDEWNVIRVWNSSKELAEHFGVKPAYIRKAIYRKHRLRGFRLRYNKEDYEKKRTNP